MLSACERQLLFFYLSNAASRLHHTSPGAKSLAEWIGENGELLELEEDGEEQEEDLPYEKKLSAREWRRLREALEAKHSACEGAPPDRTAQRLRLLGREMDLATEDVAILELLLRYRAQPALESLIDAVGDGLRRHRLTLNVTNPYLVCLLGLSSGAFLSRFTADAPLMKAGLVSVDYDGDLEPVKRLYRLVHLPDEDGLDVRGLLLDAAAPGELEWSDFDHLAEERDHIEKVVKGALRSGARGVNVLVYGPPGTGKTEFCKTLAVRLGTNLYSVGEVDEEGDEPARRERLQDLRFAQRLLAGGRGSVLLFDEMEDLLSDPGDSWIPFSPFGSSKLRSGGSKVFMNRLLERAPVPTLWTSNSARETCPTVLRRMTFALELRPPPCRTRARIWSRELARHGIEAAEEDAHSLAREFEVAPGLASGAVAAASLCGGDLAAVRRGVRSLSRVISGDKPPANQAAPERFDPALIRADVDPVRLAERLEGTGNRRFSLCLQGPPGTGKSAFVRYLAERLGLQVTQEAGLRPDVHVGGRDRAADRRRLRRGPRRGVDPGLRRGRLAAGRPPRRRALLGGEPGQRDADLDGEPPPALRVHDQLRRAPRPRHPAALHLQDRPGLPHSGPVEGGLPRLFRDRGSARRRGPHHPDTGRLRGGAPQGRDPRPSGGCGGSRRIAARRVRVQARAPRQDRIPVATGTPRAFCGVKGIGPVGVAPY